MIIIDSEKCIGCGKCVDDCVNNYLRIDEDENGHKHSETVKKGNCIECGHCMAICPVAAITNDKTIGVPEDDDLLNLMGCKRTVRKYVKDAKISQGDLDRIVLAGQTAPTNRNRKTTRIIFVKEKLPTVYNTALDYLVEKVQNTGTINPLYVPTMRMNENRDEILWNAEYLVAIAGLPQNTVDAAISAERMQLEAEKLGYGSAYRGDMTDAINNVADLRTIFNLRSNEEILISFTLGVPAVQYNRPAVKQNRKILHI